MTRLIALVLTLTFTFTPLTLHAQTAGTNSLVRLQMTGLAMAAEMYGFTTADWSYRGELRNGRVETFTLTLPAGREHVIVAACDGDCRDLDLAVAELDGTAVVADRDLNDMPVVVVPDGHPGNHVLTVTMAACSVNPCRYEVAAFSRSTPRANRIPPASSAPTSLRRTARF